MTDKMTNKKALTYAIENCDLPAEVKAKFEKMVEQLDKKSGTERKPTARQTENAVIRERLVEFIDSNYVEGSDGFTVSDLLKVCPAVEGDSNQHVSSLLRQAIQAGEVSKGSVKRRTYFAPVGVYEAPAEAEG